MALDEIVVTAQKREQNIQDVGITVNTFSGTQIQELGFTKTTDIVAMTPGLNYTVPNAESSQINFFLRGVGLNDFADANENPVAVYVDDLYRPAMGGLSIQLFDIDRVEVLRGPQGTLFGRNTTGGLVHFISNRPSTETDGYANLTLGEFNQVKFEGAIGGGFTDSTSGRLSIATNQHDGWTENRGPAGDYNESDAIAVRGQVLFDPSDRVDVLLHGHYSDNDAQVGAWQHQATTLDANGESVLLGPNEQSTAVDCNGNGVPGEPEDARPAPGTDCFGYRDTDGDPFSGEYDRDGRVEVETSSVGLNIDWDIGEVTLTSITGFQNVDRLQSEDTEASPAPLILPTFAAETDTLTQEFRISGGSDRFRWLGGLYYFDNEVTGMYDLDLSNLGFVIFDANYTQETDSTALFGQVEFDISDKWALTLGGRASSEEKELNYVNVDTSGLFELITGSAVAFDFRSVTVGEFAVQDNDYFSGKVQLDWRPNENLLLFGALNQGVKSAGFNVGFLDQNFIFASNTVETIPFDEETLRSVELGFKASAPSGRARINGAAFFYDYEDFQTFRFELLNQVIFNTDAEVAGFELDFQASPAEGWDIGLGLAFMDATAQDIPTPDGTGMRDRDMVAAPDLSLSALVRYEWLALGGAMAIQAWGNFQDETYYDIQNVPISLADSYTVGNLRFSYQSNSGRWEAAAFVHNVTDEEYLSYTFDFTGTFGFNQQAFGAPRWAGVSFQYNIL